MKKSANVLFGLSVMFLVLAIALSLVLWNDVPLAARIGLFVFGFASGILAGQWLVKRNA